jgi:hypothetical protein
MSGTATVLDAVVAVGGLLSGPFLSMMRWRFRGCEMTSSRWVEPVLHLRVQLYGALLNLRVELGREGDPNNTCSIIEPRGRWN